MGGSVPNMSLETGGVARGPVEDKGGLMIGCLAIAFFKTVQKVARFHCTSGIFGMWELKKLRFNKSKRFWGQCISAALLYAYQLLHHPSVQQDEWSLPANWTQSILEDSRPTQKRSSPQNTFASPPAFQWGSAQGIALWAVLLVDSWQQQLMATGVVWGSMVDCVEREGGEKNDIAWVWIHDWVFIFRTTVQTVPLFILVLLLVGEFNYAWCYMLLFLWEDLLLDSLWKPQLLLLSFNCRNGFSCRNAKWGVLSAYRTWHSCFESLWQTM